MIARWRTSLTRPGWSPYADHTMQQDVPLSRTSGGLTPDFYVYPDQPPASAELAGAVARIRWADGLELDAYALWLFENQMGDVTIEERSRESKFDPLIFPPTTCCVT